MKHKIALLIPYFGQWPQWMNFFVESCRANRTIDWVVIGDAAPPANEAPNVRYLTTTFEQYRELLSERLKTRVRAADPYKLCDIRPALPHVHADLVSGYDFVGFGDLDVIYGDLRAFYGPDLLDRYDLLSTHPDRVSGHLCLMRNVPEMVSAFERAPGWKHAVGRAEHCGFDERGMYDFFCGKGLLGRSRTQLKGFFREAHSTPGPTDRMRWFWKDGVLTNEFYPHHPFMYLHFMSWHSNRWYADQPAIDSNSAAPWTELPNIVQMDWRNARKDGFMISPAGIHPLPRAAPEPA